MGPALPEARRIMAVIPISDAEMLRICDEDGARERIDAARELERAREERLAGIASIARRLAGMGYDTGMIFTTLMRMGATPQEYLDAAAQADDELREAMR